MLEVTCACIKIVIWSHETLNFSFSSVFVKCVCECVFGVCVSSFFDVGVVKYRHLVAS